MIRAIAILMVLGTASACVKKHEPEAARTSQGPAMSELSVIIDRHQDSIMSIPGVTGIGESSCSGSPCIKVFLEFDSPETTARIPKFIDSIPVVTEVTGTFNANQE